MSASVSPGASTTAIGSPTAIVDPGSAISRRQDPVHLGDVFDERLLGFDLGEWVTDSDLLAHPKRARPG